MAKQVQIGGKNSQCIQTGGTLNISGKQRSSDGYQEITMNGVHVLMKNGQIFVNGVNIKTNKRHGLSNWQIIGLMHLSFFMGIVLMGWLMGGFS